MKTLLRRTCIVLGLVFLPWSSATAQLVRGVVRGPDSVAVRGAIITLSNSAGAALVRGYSRANGFFEIRAPGPGRYAITVDRLGYEPVTEPDVTVSGLVTNLSLVPTTERRVLTPGPAAESACVLGIELNGRAASLWQAARQSLTAVAVAEASKQLGREVARYQRQRSLDGQKVANEKPLPTIRVAERPFPSLSEDSLAKIGYIHGDSTYFLFEAPDARVFTGDRFVATHCFAEVPGERQMNGKRVVGLRFEPVGTGTVVEVGGVFWIDRATGVLSEISWTYAPQPAKKGSFGGEQRIAVDDATGLAYVAAWDQRMPNYVRTAALGSKFVLTIDRQLRYSTAWDLDVASMNEEGGTATPLR